MARYSGPWNRDAVERYLTETVSPLRLGCHSPSGWPLIISLWYVYRDGALWCATQADANTARHLRSDGRCAFEVATNEPPYKGVRGRGQATVAPQHGDAVLRMVISRYLGGEDSALARWLLGRADREVAIRIDPVGFTSWDFTARMTSPPRGVTSGSS